MMPEGDSLKSSLALTVEADLDRLPQIMNAVSDVMNEHGFDPQDVFEVQLAVEEACTNIIRHAYEGRTGLIYIAIIAEKGELKISLEDYGPQFDPTEHMTMRQREPDDIHGPVGGWGIELIRSVMDEMSYKRNLDRNVLNLVKRRVL